MQIGQYMETIGSIVVYSEKVTFRNYTFFNESFPKFMYLVIVHELSGDTAQWWGYGFWCADLCSDCIFNVFVIFLRICVIFTFQL
jgi:hypothetical protein